MHLPRELWERVLDHVGVDLHEIQLTCRMFRDICVRKLWSGVTISFRAEKLQPGVIQCRQICQPEACQILSAVSPYINGLVVEMTDIAAVIKYGPAAMQALRVAMRSATNIRLIVRADTFNRGNIAAELRNTLEKLGRANKLTVMFRDLVGSHGELVDSHGELVNLRGEHVDSDGELVDSHGELVNSYGNLVDLDGDLVPTVLGDVVEYTIQQLEKSVAFLESISATIEADLSILTPAFLPRQISEHIRLLTVKLCPFDYLEHLLQKCPQVESLCAGSMSPGRLVLPEHIREFELIDAWAFPFPADGLFVVASNYVTRLTVDAERLERDLSQVEFPNLRSLELVLDVVGPRCIEKLKPLTKRLDQVRVDFKALRNDTLVKIAPLIRNVKDIRLSAVGVKIFLFDLKPHLLEHYKQYILDHFTLLENNRHVRKLHLELPSFDPETIETIIVLLLKVCPLIEHLSLEDTLTNESDVAKRYPYLHRPIRYQNSDWQEDVYQVDLQKIRSSSSVPCDLKAFLRGLTIQSASSS